MKETTNMDLVNSTSVTRDDGDAIHGCLSELIDVSTLTMEPSSVIDIYFKLEKETLMNFLSNTN